MKKDSKVQDVEKVKGRAMLRWDGKHPLGRVEYFPAQEKEVYGDKKAKEFNKLFWGDNLQVLSHLLKEYRGGIDLIYIDPPFDSKADYVKKVLFRGASSRTEGVQKSLIEEKQYSDIWDKDEYLQFMYDRLILLRELLSETGSLYLHCDWHKNAHLRLIADEVFGEGNFQNEIIWHYKSFHGQVSKYFPRKHDTILFYKRTPKSYFNLMRNEEVSIDETVDYKNWNKYIVNDNEIRGNNMPSDVRFKRYLDKWIEKNGRKPTADDVVFEFRPQTYDDVWEISYLDPKDKKERTDYPTQKPEALLERIIKSSTKEGDVVLDCFVGSGTTCATAQKLGRRWIGCDLNTGAIQTATKRLNQIIEAQAAGRTDERAWLLDQTEIGEAKKHTLAAFKVLNVNEYDVFKNEVEAKQIIMDMYGVEKVRTPFFDGILDKNFVKVMPINRVCSKKDVDVVLKGIKDSVEEFKVRTKSRHGEPVYDQGVTVFCSGMEMDMIDYMKKENKSGVEVDVRDILLDKETLIFKQKPEAEISVMSKEEKVVVKITEFISPILIRKLDIENEKALKKEGVAKIKDFRQIIDSVAIDVDYDGKLFNAEIIDVPAKSDLIKGEYVVEYTKKGKKKLAVKIVDVLGEEYFETFEVTA